MISFENTETAFQAKSTKDLRKALFLYNMVRFPAIVKFGKAMLPIAFKLGIPIEKTIRNTVYEIFCGGETIERCWPTIRHLGEFGVKTILDYSVEGKETESDFDAARDATIATLDYASEHREFIPFSVFKPTALGRFELWEKVNAGERLNSEEKKEFERVKARFYAIADKSKEVDIPVLVDAEESWIQTAVDDLVLDMMRSYNKEKALIYNTLQMYRRDRLEYLQEILSLSIGDEFFLGLKLVRGAYMEKERIRSIEMGYDSPIQLTKADTDQDYNQALNLCIDHINNVGLVAGTHNEQSSLRLTALMEQKGLEKDDQRIYFSQLLGMSDHISYNLSDHGYNVVKYVPFGPVRDVMPYLLRRAEENTSVGGQTSRELTLIQREIKRRRTERNRDAGAELKAV